ncbi:melanoma-associated antigen B4-like [Manis pentadactyla]|uniref:melanoma-associated antigen B4-like n=1 Tax=Manis pentadactyla TaxID=143292 RepID=UPI00255C6818|nr:melanoma-associated antigen B4-like [Manis pentadactyla]
MSPEPKTQEGSASQDKQGTGRSQAAVPACRACKHVITRKVNKLGQLLLEKCKTKGQVTQAVLLKIVRRKYRHLYSKIFRRTSELMELLFGLELREANRRSQAYTLVGKLGLPNDAILSSDSGLPTTGLIMLLLGVIFMKGNRATEEQVREFLNTLGVYAGRRHLIFREPQRFITNELLQQKYLEYCQVPDRDPPRYEFLWGAKAHAETSKMKVPEVLEKINNRVPSSFSNLYEGTLRHEKEVLEATPAARDTTRAAAKAGAKKAAQALLRPLPGPPLVPGPPLLPRPLSL